MQPYNFRSLRFLNLRYYLSFFASSTSKSSGAGRRGANHVDLRSSIAEVRPVRRLEEISSCGPYENRIGFPHTVTLYRVKPARRRSDG